MTTQQVIECIREALDNCETCVAENARNAAERAKAKDPKPTREEDAAATAPATTSTSHSRERPMKRSKPVKPALTADDLLVLAAKVGLDSIDLAKSYVRVMKRQGWDKTPEGRRGIRIMRAAALGKDYASNEDLRRLYAPHTLPPEKRQATPRRTKSKKGKRP